MKQRRRKSLPALEGGIPLRKKFLVFGSPLLGKAERDEVIECLRTGWLGTGPKVAKFEEMVRKFISAKYAVGIDSCTSGLHLSLLACGVGAGDEVITTPMTFASTANVIEHVGAKPVFVDIELPSMNIDPANIERKINKRTKAIMPVHMAGRACRMDEIMKIAKRHGLKVIEDAAHAFGAEYKGKKVGSIGDLTVFSFYITKNLVTGEGGMVLTDKREYADFIQMAAMHGMDRSAWKRYSDEGFKHYLIKYPGYKYNLIDLHAAIGIHQFARFKEGQKKRKKIWNQYSKEFSDLPVEIPAEPEPDSIHAYHLYTILVDKDKLKADREVIQHALHAENIGIGIHFIALHLHPYYRKKYGYKRGDYPVAEHVSDRTISLPFSAKLTKSDVKDVIKAVRKVLLYYLENKPRSSEVKLPQAAKIVG
jgi:dTDP-4-amino-4,6-dideoxygalactose transaminase